MATHQKNVKGRLISEATSRGANKKSIIIFAVGINDSSRLNNANRVSLMDYVRSMEGLIHYAEEHFTKRISCIGLSPIDQARAVPFILEKGISFYAASQREYDSALERVCNKKGVGYVSLRNLGIESHLSEDGVHPLTSGHDIIARSILEATEALAQ